MFFGNIGGTLGRQVAAAMRGYGVEAEFVGSADPEAMRKAQQGCSGKECLPYQLIWGTFTRFLEEKLPELNGAPALFLTVGTGFAACRRPALSWPGRWGSNRGRSRRSCR